MDFLGAASTLCPLTRCSESTEMGRAGFHERRMAPKMHRNRYLQEQRARMLDAVRATYADFWEDSYVNSAQLNKLQVSAHLSGSQATQGSAKLPLSACVPSQGRHLIDLWQDVCV